MLTHYFGIGPSNLVQWFLRRSKGKKLMDGRCQGMRNAHLSHINVFFSIFLELSNLVLIYVFNIFLVKKKKKISHTLR